jgi:dihydroorotase (multifunctional complex type)
MRADRVIRGGLVASPGGLRSLDVAITGGQISALLEPGTEITPTEDVDADGLLVMPGMVDVHVHTRDPGYTHKEDMTTCSMAAAAGGVTTIFAMPNLNPAPADRKTLGDILEHYSSTSLVDFNVNPVPTRPEEIGPMAAMGVAAFKVYMVVDSGRDYQHPAGVGVHDHGRLLQIMEDIAPTGLPFMIHPHDQSLMDHLEQRFWKRGDRSPSAYAQSLASYDGVIWDTAIGVILRLAEAAGCRLHIVHAQTPRTLEMITDARRRGVDVTAEVNHWALFLSRWDDIERLGPYALSYFVPESARDALWAGIRDETIDILSSDHAPHTREEKEVGWTDMWAAHSGTPGIEFQLPLLLDAARGGHLTVERVVDLVATRPARIFGLASKGVLVPGADADIAMVDLESRWTITNDHTFTKVGWTPYDGRTIGSRVVRTIVRGVDIFRDGVIVSEPGHGRHARPTSGAS